MVYYEVCGRLVVCGDSCACAFIQPQSFYQLSALRGRTNEGHNDIQVSQPRVMKHGRSQPHVMKHASAPTCREQILFIIVPTISKPNSLLLFVRHMRGVHECVSGRCLWPREKGTECDGMGGTGWDGMGWEGI